MKSGYGVPNALVTFVLLQQIRAWEKQTKKDKEAKLKPKPDKEAK